MAAVPNLTTHNLAPCTLITFDVDGTLVKGSGKMVEASAHSRAFAHAVGYTFGHAPTALPSVALPEARYHGSTDGLIALNLAFAELGILPSVAFEKLPVVFRAMYSYVSELTDDEAVKEVNPLPGVVATLHRLADQRRKSKGALMCGLVTGNVEGIARKKMRATGLFGTGVFTEKSPEQTWEGEEDAAFLGGFGSDFCSGDINDLSRVFKDRGEQIGIAFRRAQAMAKNNGFRITHVVHVGDAPGKPSSLFLFQICSDREREKKALFK